MDLQEYYKECNSGGMVDSSEVFAYIKTFKTVILWGGSFLGKAVGKRLLKEEVAITKYWDLRKDELKEVNGV